MIDARKQKAADRRKLLAEIRRSKTAWEKNVQAQRDLWFDLIAHVKSGQRERAIATLNVMMACGVRPLGAQQDIVSWVLRT